MTIHDPHDTGIRFMTYERPARDGKFASYEVSGHVGITGGFENPRATLRSNRIDRPGTDDIRWWSIHFQTNGNAEAERFAKDNGEVFYVVRKPGQTNGQLFIDEATALAIHHAVAAAHAQEWAERNTADENIVVLRGA